MQEIIQELTKAHLTFRCDEPMSLHTTFKAGGRASVYVEPKDANEFVQVFKLVKKTGIKYLVIGCGSNLLITDNGFKGVVISTANLMGISVKGDIVTANSGEKLSSVCKFGLDNGLTGMEFAGGIPGSVGGGLYMNAGAYGGELKDIVCSAKLLVDGEIKEYSADKLALSYRHSIVEDISAVVLSVDFKLLRGDVVAARAKLKELNTRRRDKQPLDKPSAGSTFKRPAGNFAGTLIEKCGLKGFCIGGACVSTKHAGFIVNNGGATASDIISLIQHVKRTVYKEYGIDFQPEVKIIGE